MAQITVLNKAGAVQQSLNTKALDVNQLAQQSGAKIKVGQSEVVKIEINPDQIAKIERIENNAVITLKNGEKVTLEGFFDVADNRLLLQEGEKVWQVEGVQHAPAGELAISYLPVETGVGVPVAEHGLSSENLLLWGAGLLGVGAVAAAAGSSDGGSSAPADTTPPIAGKLVLANLDDTGASASDHITRDQNFTLKLQGQESGATVQYQLSSDNGKTWHNTSLDQSKVADGVYLFRAVVTDKAGNQAISNVETVSIDRHVAAGWLSLSGFSDSGTSGGDHITRDQNFTLKLAGHDSGTTVLYQLSADGGKTWKDTTQDQTSLADGTYLFRVQVTDKAGNTAVTNTEKVTIDTQITASNLSLVGFIDSGTSATDHVTKDYNFKLKVAGREHGAAVQFQLSADGGKTWYDTTAEQTGLDSGTYQFRAVFSDNAGNKAFSNIETVVVDRVLNTAAIQLVINNVSADNSIDLLEAQQAHLITGSLKNLPSDIDSYQLSLLIGEASYTVAVDGATGQWSVLVPGTVLWQAGNIQASLQLIDKAGNQASVVKDKEYQLNPIPEAPTQLQATIDTFFSDIVVTGTAFAGSEIKIKDAAGNTLASGTAKVDGSFELLFNNGFVDGQKISVTATVNGHESVIGQSELLRVSPLYVTSVNQDGYLQGFAEQGSVISIYDDNHQLIKEFTFYPSFPFFGNTFTVALDHPLAEGARLFVVASKNGVESRTESLTVDFTLPAAATNLGFNELGQLTGQAEANSFIQVLDKNNNYVGSGRTDDDGYFVADAYTYVSNSTIFNNGELLKVVVLDANRNTSAAVEIKAPDILVAPQVRAIGKDGSISGIAEAGSTIIIKDATGKVIASTDSQANGSFSVTLSNALKNGQEIIVSATNGKGQTSNDSTVVVDFKAPAAPHDLLFNADGTLLIGKAEPFSTVNVSIGDQPLYVYRQVDANGNFTIQLNTALHDGQKLSISVTDRNANQSKTTEVSAPDYILPPVVSGEVGVDNQLQGVINEPNATIIVKDADGKQLELKGLSIESWGAFSASIVSPLKHGQQLTVIAVDAHGHESKAVTIKVDYVAPKVAADVVLAEDGQTLSGKAEANTIIKVLDTAGAVIGQAQVNADGEFKFKLSGFFLKGEALKVQVTDAAGNSSKLKSVIAPVDKVAPDAAQDLVIDQYGRTLSGTGEVNSVVYLYSPSKQNVISTIVGADGKFSFSFWNEPYVRGEKLTVVLEDRAGNRSQAVSVSAPLDQTAPDKASAVEMQQSGNVLAGKAEPYGAIKVRTTWGEIVGETSADNEGNFKVYLNNVFVKGETLTVQVIDAAGNSSKVLKFVAPLDSTPPAAPSEVAVSAAGNVISGQAEAYGKIIISNDQGVVVGQTTANSEGQFSLYTSDYFLKGQQLKVVVIDAAGNSGLPVFITAPVDSQAPDAAVAVKFDGNGNLVGNSAGEEVTVLLKNQAGHVIDSSSSGSSGFTFYARNFELYQGQDVVVVLVDHAGNESKPVTIKIPVSADALATPANLVLSDNGLLLTGTAPVGSTIQLYNSQGQEISSYGTVDAKGHFSVNIWQPQLDGKPLAVYAYKNGKLSIAASILTPLDNTAPGAPEIVSVSGGENGTGSISGFAEKGSVVLLKDESGNIRSYATVDSETGRFSLSSNAIATGQKLTVVAVDAALNTSKATAVIQPVSPQAPAAATGLQVAEDGLSLSGSALANTKIIVFNSGNAVGTGVTDASGHFKVTFDTLLVHGEPLQVIVQKGPYRSLPAAITAPVDTTAPDVATHLKVSADGHVVTGRAEANASVSIRDEHGGWIGDGNADASGKFKITLYNAYTKGQLLNVEVIDQAGNKGEKVLLVAPVDTTPPGIASNVVIGANGLIISGTAEAGATIVVKDENDNRIDAWGSTVNSGGHFGLNLYEALSDGQKLTVFVIDSAGNQSQELVVTVDLNNSELSKPAFIWFDTDGASFSGAGEPGTTITVKDKDGNVLSTWWESETSNSGVFDGQLSASLEQGQVVYLIATDAAGNESKPQQYVFKADRTPPAEATDLLVAPDGRNLTGSAEPLSHIEVRDARGSYVGNAIVDGYGKFHISLSRFYQNGEVLKVIVFDRAGNGSGFASVTAPKDEVAPEVATKLQFSDDGSLLSGLAEAGAYVRVLDRHGNQINYDYDTVDSSGRFEVQLYNHYLHGEKLKVVIEDRAGNQSVARKVTAPLDDTAPEAAVSLVFNQAGNRLYGVAEAGATVRVLDANGKQVNYSYETVDEDGFFATSLYSSYLKGQKLTVVVEDIAGNKGAAATVVAPLDKTAPAAPHHLQFDKNGERLTGFGEPNTSLNVKNEKGEVLATTSSSSTGEFSFYFFKPLLQGQQVSVYAVDLAGNKGKTVVITAPLDITAPEPASHLSIVDNYLQGTAESGATIVLKDANGLQLNTTTTWSDNFDIYIDVGLYQGQNIQVIVVDKAGNTSTATTFSVPVSPDAPATATALVFSEDGRYLSGKAEPGTYRVEVRDSQTGGYYQASVGKNGNFKVDLGENYLHGEILSIRVVSSSGYYSQVVAVTAPLDNTPPDVPHDVLLKGTGSYSLSGIAEANSTVRVTDADGQPIDSIEVDKSGKFYFAFDDMFNPAVTPGSIISVVVTDLAGNRSDVLQLTIPQDTTPPDQPQGLSAEGNFIATEQAVTNVLPDTDIHSVLQQAETRQMSVAVGTADSDVVNSGVNVAQLLATDTESSVAGLIKTVISEQPQDEPQKIEFINLSESTAISNNAIVVPALIANSLDVASLLNTQQFPL